MTVFRPALLTAMVLLPLLVVACGGEDSAPADASTSAPSVKPPPKPPAPVGDATVTQGAVPDDFPSDFPIFPDSESTGAIGLGKGPMIASFSTAASVADVVAFYDSALEDSGWSVEDSDAKAGTVNASKGRRSAIVRVNASRVGTNIAVVLEGS